MSESTQIQAGLPPSASNQRPRKGRWWRVVLAGLAILLLGAGGWFGWSHYSMQSEWAAAVEEAADDLPRWKLLDMEEDREKVPDNENSALLIIALMPKFRPLKLSGAANYDLIFEKLPPNAQLNLQQEQLIRPEMARLGNAVNEARKLKDMPRGRFPIRYTDDAFSTLLPNHQDARMFADLFRHDAMLLAQDGEIDQAVESCQACVNLGGTMRDELLLISLLIRIAMVHIAADSLERVLAQGEASEPALKAVQASMERRLAENAWLPAMRGERALQHHFFDNLRTGKVNIGSVRGMFGLAGIVGGRGPSVQERVLEMFPSLLLKFYPDHLRFMNRGVEIAKLPIHERGSKLDEWEQDIKKSKNLVTRLLAPAINKVGWAETRGQAYVRSAVAAVACERYRLKHGRWPQTLDVLVQEKLLDAVPVDPIDNQPLRYRRTKEGVVIYSIGIDKKDNGGNINRERAMDPGVDLGIRLWDLRARRLHPLPPVGIPEIGN